MSMLDRFLGEEEDNMGLNYGGSPPLDYLAALDDESNFGWLEDDGDSLMKVEGDRDVQAMSMSVRESLQHQLQRQLGPGNAEGLGGGSDMLCDETGFSLGHGSPKGTEMPAPPCPPPPPPAAYLTSSPYVGSSGYAAASYYPYLYPVHSSRHLSPQLSDAHSQHLSEMSYGTTMMYPRARQGNIPFYPPPPPTMYNPTPVMEQRTIAPKPPTMPPPNYFWGDASADSKPSSVPKGGAQRIGRTPVAASRKSNKVPRYRAKRKSVNVKGASPAVDTKAAVAANSLRPDKREIRNIQQQFIASSEVSEQLATLRAQLEKSEAESDFLKQRLSSTENELKFLREKVKQYGGMPTASLS
mmetsp:Transcript_1749/g.4771  ORF Transcript_1749/g.4771 Transcript_1749/m.4771 type:complete len:355 (+) Transcript_1749:71-1135(+)|eukprot:CAMPEP_0119129668 /NCGR_PEP_ID=MMETSP1310-20130426/7317_1 /TAXON_ID=464262 /ORGANISM="Genus nov. species nov., Strain RCC2339" /LENGTH=354 /DNA_ID=CAMNT_0007120103 /DNA_START=70 /DNA_END=1134 /DNA_ORIENTATION=-